MTMRYAPAMTFLFQATVQQQQPIQQGRRGRGMLKN